MKVGWFLGVASLIFSACGVFAADITNSEFQHQTAKGVWEFTPQIAYGAINYHFSPSETSDTTEVSDKLFNFGVAGEYGLNEMFSLGVRLAYQSDNSSISTNDGSSAPSAKGTGLVDPDIYLNALVPTPGGSFRFGTHLTFALDSFNLGSSTNEYSGGVTLSPFVGYENAFSTGLGGVRLAYDLIQTDRTWRENGGSQSLKVKDGNRLTLTAFYELNVQPVIWGFDVGVVNHHSSTLAANGLEVDAQNGYTSFQAEVYLAYSASAEFTLLPKIGYGTLASGSGFPGLMPYTSSSGGLYASVAGRFTF